MSTALTRRTTTAPTRTAPAQITGSAKNWALDLAIVGGISSFVAPMSLVLFSPAIYLLEPLLAFAVVASVVGSASGAALGLVMPSYLNLVRKRVPLPLLVVGHPIIGALWGGLAGLVAATFTVGLWFAVFPTLLAAMVGALQFGWLWLPYTIQTVMGGMRWPLVALSGAVALFAPWVSYLLLGFLF